MSNRNKLTFKTVQISGARQFVKNKYGTWRKIFYKSCIGYIKINTPLISLTEDYYTHWDTFKNFFIKVLFSLAVDGVCYGFFSIFEWEFTRDIAIYIIISIMIFVISYFLLSEILDKK